MSTKGIFTALSGAMAQSNRLDTIANNIANANTTAFKKDRQVFKEYLTEAEKPQDLIQSPRIPASIESFYDHRGGDKSYVNSVGTFTDFSQGSLKPTSNAMDMAINGPGFFEVLTPNGVRLTRSGMFKTDVNGRLTTKQGFPVLSAGVGTPGAARVINTGGQALTVSQNGDIYSQGKSLGKISLVNVTKPDQLFKEGNSLYVVKDPVNNGATEASQAQVLQGFVEQSNVNIVAEMTNMISATRTFESTQKAIKAFDTMNGRLVNDVPRVK